MSRDIPLPSPKELREELPINEGISAFIDNARITVKNILDGLDPRMLLIVGPCSIHNVEEALEYALKLKELRNKVQEKFYIVMRAYFEKPRTSIGWKGLLLDPELDGSYDIVKGMHLTRQLLLNIAELGIPSAAEFLSPTSSYYYGDLITWGCIGARTSESQPHREIASGLSMPIAFKNNTDGNPHVAVNGALSASLPHTFIGMNENGTTSVKTTQGNPYSHIVLRGGSGGTNYDPASISIALNALETRGQKRRLIIDCSHDNAEKHHQKQIAVFKSVIHQVVEGNDNIYGLVLESNLNEGSQQLKPHPSKLAYGISITDPCLSWEATEELILWGHQSLSHSFEDKKTQDLHATTITYH